MLAVQNKNGRRLQKCEPNVLPCRVRHNGAVDASKRYWSPKTNEDGTRTAYFRGRKLHGDVVQVPKGYRGAILEKTEQMVESCRAHVDEEDLGPEREEDEDSEVEKCRAMEEIASFDQIVVWGHEKKRDQDEDPYFKSIGQWINLAQAIHSHDSSMSSDQ